MKRMKTSAGSRLATVLLAAGWLAVAGCQPNCEDLVFPDAADSPYLLPYPVGTSYVVSQSYCNPLGGHRNRIAVDFMMPMGAQILAARGGKVINVVSHFEDGDLRRGHNNRVLVMHEDGSIAWYGHLQQDSVSVVEGDVVTQGQALARCGNSGNTGNLPHLHFEVFRSRPYDYDDAIPVSFRNAKGPTDARGGLVKGQSYEAVDVTARPEAAAPR